MTHALLDGVCRMLMCGQRPLAEERYLLVHLTSRMIMEEISPGNSVLLKSGILYLIYIIMVELRVEPAFIGLWAHVIVKAIMLMKCVLQMLKLTLIMRHFVGPARLFVAKRNNLRRE